LNGRGVFVNMPKAVLEATEQQMSERRSKKLALILLLAAGCAPLGGMQQERVAVPQRSRESQLREISVLLHAFERGVRQDDVELLMTLYSPQLTDEERTKEGNRLERALRSFRYSEYKLYCDPAQLKVEKLPSGPFLDLELDFQKPGGKRGDDVFHLQRVQGKWYLRKASLETPKKGEEADLPEAERAEIAAVVAKCNDAILRGDVDPVLAQLDPSMPRAELVATKDSITEMLKLYKYRYVSSSFTPGSMKAEFGSKGTIRVPVDLFYAKLTGERGERKIAYIFARRGGSWALQEIKLRGSALWRLLKKFGPQMIEGGARAASGLMR